MTTDLAIRAPRAIVWDALADLEGVSHWNPAIDRAECISDRRTVLGARRRCYMHPSGWMVESVAEWEPLEVIAFEVGNAPPSGAATGDSSSTTIPRAPGYGERSTTKCASGHSARLSTDSWSTAS